jgi:uncharacterized membrane protein
MHGERIRLEAVKSLIKSLNNNKGYAISLALALILVSSLLLGYYLLSRQPPEGYTTIDLLDSQKKAMDYPELLVVNRNNTFNVWVEVENHMGKSEQCEVLLKATDEPLSQLPVEVNAVSNYTKTLENNQLWETLVPVSINAPGNYSVIFELWIYNQNAGTFQFTYNYCVLKVEVVDRV